MYTVTWLESLWFASLSLLRSNLSKLKASSFIYFICLKAFVFCFLTYSCLFRGGECSTIDFWMPRVWCQKKGCVVVTMNREYLLSYIVTATWLTTLFCWSLAPSTTDPFLSWFPSAILWAALSRWKPFMLQPHLLSYTMQCLLTLHWVCTIILWGKLMAYTGPLFSYICSDQFSW